jgi:hypothetical protein
MIVLDFSGINLKLKQENNKTLVFDIIRKKWVILTPEEHVRQYILHYLCEKLKYPKGLISVEKQIMLGHRAKRFDIVVFNKDHEPWLLAECKSPDVDISNATLYQLLNYHSVLPCTYWLLTNGHQTLCADACDVQNIKWMESLPIHQG